jgi:hypothetical protein
MRPYSLKLGDLFRVVFSAASLGVAPIFNFLCIRKVNVKNDLTEHADAKLGRMSRSGQTR